jgi:hypothetical protein
LAEPAQAWDRRKTESDRAWASFSIFLDLGPYRTIHQAVKAHLTAGERLPFVNCSHYQQRFRFHPDPKRYTLSVYSQWRSWSGQHEWRNRALAYDTHCAEVQRTAELEARSQRARADAEAEDRERDLFLAEARALRGIGRTVANRLLQVLRDPTALAQVGFRRLKVVEKEIEVDDRGVQRVRRSTETVTPGALDLLGDSASVIEIGQKLERLFQGQPTEIVEELTPEERALRQRLEMLALAAGEINEEEAAAPQLPAPGETGGVVLDAEEVAGGSDAETGERPAEGE